MRFRLKYIMKDATVINKFDTGRKRRIIIEQNERKMLIQQQSFQTLHEIKKVRTNNKTCIYNGQL